jgi:hypothetical protein
MDGPYIRRRFKVTVLSGRRARMVAMLATGDVGSKDVARMEPFAPEFVAAQQALFGKLLSTLFGRFKFTTTRRGRKSRRFELGARLRKRLAWYVAHGRIETPDARRRKNLPNLRKGDSIFAVRVVATARRLIDEGCTPRRLNGQIHTELVLEAEEMAGHCGVVLRKWDKDDPRRPPSRSQVGRIRAEARRAGTISC